MSKVIIYWRQTIVFLQNEFALYVLTEFILLQIQVMVEMSQPTVEPSEMTHTDYVEERVSSEEEEDIFFETEEPEIPGEEVTVDLGTAALKDKPSQSALTLEEILSVEGAEEAHIEFTEEETLPEEVRYTLSEAEKEAAKPSLVGTQEQVVEPQAAETFETGVSFFFTRPIQKANYVQVHFT